MSLIAGICGILAALLRIKLIILSVSVNVCAQSSYGKIYCVACFQEAVYFCESE